MVNNVLGVGVVGETIPLEEAQEMQLFVNWDPWISVSRVGEKRRILDIVLAHVVLLIQTVRFLSGRAVFDFANTVA